MKSLLTALALALGLAACSTPQPALDTANNGAALSAALEAELREFRRVQAVVASHRIDSIRAQRKQTARFQSDADFGDRVLVASGQDDRTALYLKLRALSDSRIKDEKDLAASNAAIDATLAKLLTPVPEGAEKLKPVEEAFAAMGQELSAADRAKIVYSFGKEVKKAIDDNAEKIRQAEAQDIGPAPMQSK
jgi:hypothetical protein